MNDIHPSDSFGSVAVNCPERRIWSAPRSGQLVLAGDKQYDGIRLTPRPRHHESKRRSIDSVWPVDPILRPGVAVSNDHDPDHRIANNVGNVVTENLEIDASIAARAQARHLGVLRRPGDVLVQLIPEPHTQTAQLLFVDGGQKLQAVCT